MAGTDAERLAVVDFEEFARARQHTLVRAAFLVFRDERQAQDRVRAALLDLARHWTRVRYEQPDLFVLRVLYAGVLSLSMATRGPGEDGSDPADDGPDEAWDAGARSRLETSLSESVWEEPDDTWEVELGRRRARVLRALDRLTPRQRAEIVLLFLDERGEREAGAVLGSSGTSVGAEAEEAVALLRAGLPPGSLEDVAWRARDLKDLLQLASDDMPAMDLVDGLWEEAHRQHRTVVRRTVLGVGALAAGGVVLSVVLREPPTDQALRPSGSAVPQPSRSTTTPATAAADGRLDAVEVGGVSVFLAPDPVAERQLPRYPGAAELSIPGHLGPGDPSEQAVLGKGDLAGVPDAVRAVYLVNAPDSPRPVLFVPDAAVPHVLVPDAMVEGWGQAHARVISDDRHRLVFMKVRGVVVLDARDGSIVEVDVPDPTLRTAGWARDGATIIAHGRYQDWVVDTRRRSAVSAADPRYPDWADLAMGDPAALMRTFSGNGEMKRSRQLLGPPVVPNGPSVANDQQWVAAYAYLTEDYQRAAQSTQGLVAVHEGPRPTPRVLAASQNPIVPDRCYRALAWATPSVVLLESGWQQPGLEEQLRLILAWDVREGRLWQVAAIDRAEEGAGEFSGQYAI